MPWPIPRLHVPVLVSLGWILATSPARAQGKRLAVLELTGSGVEADGLTYLTGEVWGEALNYLPKGWQIMTRDNMVLLIKEAGGCFAEGTCEVDTFRTLGVDQGILGTVTHLNGGGWWLGTP